jgi:tetratricopeptide (TPR) repeat protein
MSRMLTSICDELERASRLSDSGQHLKARYILLDLSLRAELSPDELFKVRMASAKLAFARERYGEARRHLRIAERLRGDEAEIYYLWGRAYEFDPHGCDRRAARKYRKATILNASEPKYRAALGRALVRISNVRSGVKVLRRAAEAAPTDPEVLEIVREGLQEAEQAELALQILNKARFLAPGNRQVKHLWERARFDATAEIQKNNRKESKAIRDDRPISIPFIRIHSETTVETHPDAKILRVRRDGGDQIQPRLAGLKAYRK